MHADCYCYCYLCCTLPPLNAPCIKNTHPWIPTTEYWILTPQPATAVNGCESHHSHSNCIVVAATNLQSVKYQIQNVQFTNREIYTCVYEQICGLHLTSAKNRKKPQLCVHFHHKITIDYKMLVNFEILIFWKYNLNAFKCCWGVRWALWNWRERNERLKCITQNQYRLLGVLWYDLESRISIVTKFIRYAFKIIPVTISIFSRTLKIISNQGHPKKLILTCIIAGNGKG